MSVIRSLSISKEHITLASSVQFYKDKSFLSKYGLQHGAYHNAVLRKGEDLWKLMNCQDFLQEQYFQSMGFAWSFLAFQYSIAHYIEKQGQTPQDDGRLSWLLLRAGELEREALEGVDILVERFKKDFSELDHTLKGIEVLNEENHFKACLHLIMIEAWRQEDWNVERRDISIPQKILEKMDVRILDGAGISDRRNFISNEFMEWWLLLVIQTWEEIDLEVVFRRLEPSCYSSILTSTAQTLIQNGNLEKANKIFDNALEIARAITVESEKLSAISSIAIILEKNGLLEKAIETAKIINNDDVKSQTVSTIAKSMAMSLAEK